MPRTVDTLTLATGVATAQPILFISGALLTVAEAGSIEYDGSFWFTDTTGRYELNLQGAWLGTAIDATSQVVLAAGTVTRTVTVQYAVAEEVGTGADGGNITLEPNSYLSIYNDGVDIVRLTCSAGGELSISRVAGADTFTARLLAVWI